MNQRTGWSGCQVGVPCADLGVRILEHKPDETVALGVQRDDKELRLDHHTRKGDL